MHNLPPCPKCQCEHTYFNGSLAVCPECFYEWNAEDKGEADTSTSLSAGAEETVKDSNGNVLVDGDSVVVIKDLPVKGSSKSVKAGTKVKNIKLVEGDHNISCKIEGFGAMGLKSEFVRKA
ncbi:MAG: zinc ribbon domain-containing protein YjdM [Bacteroidia bacterium]|jgi:protein PhnA|nr:zinc ribbon domain-containing protein YjdM [Bacteroidia bacterium]